MKVKDKPRKLPVEPFREWLLWRFPNTELAALQTGISQERLRKIKNRRQDRVSEDLVDRALLDWPERLDDLYPEQAA